MTEAAKQKKELRIIYRQRRAKIAASLGSLWGPQELAVLGSFLKEKAATFDGKMLSYFPIGSEPALLPQETALLPQETALLPQESRNLPQGPWYFPKMRGHDLEWFSWSPSEPIPPKNPRGIPEKQYSAHILEVLGHKNAICLTPALAIDTSGFRLGYGGGFYDRLFADSNLRKRIVSVVCIHEELITEALPQEPTDLPIDLILTRTGIRFIEPEDQVLSRLGSSATNPNF